VENGAATVTTGGAVNNYLKKRADGVHLEMDRNLSPFTDTANTINTRAVAGTLDNIYNEQTDADWLLVLDWVWLMDDTELRTAMQQLCGETRASSFYMPMRTPWKFAFDRVNWAKGGRQSIYFGQQNVRDARLSTNNLWATALYDGMNMYDDDNTTSSSIVRPSFMVGYDRELTSKSGVGVVFSHSQPVLRQGTSRVEADDWLFGVHYADRVYDRYELKLWAGYGHQQYRMQRSVPIPGAPNDLSADYSGNVMTLSSMVSTPFNWKNGVFRPFAGIDLTYIQQNSALENGFEPIALEFETSDWTQFFGRVGVRTDFGWERWNFIASLTYSHLLGGQVAPHVKNNFHYVKPDDTFTIRGNNLGVGFLNLGLGTQIYTYRGKGKPATYEWVDRVKKDSMIFLQYNGNYSIRSNQQTASIGYQFVF
jgi:uncharacterized protein with beta-barrel porin domain